MVSKRILLVIMMVLMLTGMRDPFQPPADRCQTMQLTQWHYQGIVAMSGRATGIVRDATGKWRRVHEGERLPAGWRVAGFDNDEMRIAVGDTCLPQHWRWKREGTQDEKHSNDSSLSLQHTDMRSAPRDSHAGGG